jgi:hypothetical protein
MTIAQPSRPRAKMRSLFLCLAAAFAVMVLQGARSEAAGLTAPPLSGRSGAVPAQAIPETDKKTQTQSTEKKKPKKRAIRCGGPGLPDCPM